MGIEDAKVQFGDFWSGTGCFQVVTHYGEELEVEIESPITVWVARHEDEVEESEDEARMLIALEWVRQNQDLTMTVLDDSGINVTRLSKPERDRHIARENERMMKQTNQPRLV